MENLTVDALAQLEDTALRIHEAQMEPATPEDCETQARLLAKHFPPGLLTRLAIALEKAERKHPVFAEGPYQGIGRITEELGEAIQCINHGESMERLEEEAMDVLVTAFRFVRKDWVMQDNE